MIARKNKITIYKSKKPIDNNLNEDLQWVCDSLGLFGERDKDKSCFRMFVVLLKSIPTSDGLTSDEISEKVDLSRGTVVHHLHKLIGSGLVVYDGKKYRLRVNKLSALIDELEHDILRTLDEIKESAKKVDERLNL